MRLSALLALVLFVPASVRAQTSYPMITHTDPLAVRRGQSAEVTVGGQMNFAGVYRALFDDPALRAEILAGPVPRAKGPQKPGVHGVRLKVTAGPDAALGPHEFRLVSNLGVSSIGQLLVVDEPVVREKGVNNTREQANPIRLPCVICGRIEVPEDVDYFRFHAEAGQALTFEVFCARLEDKIHDLQKHADPMLTLYDATGREVAANDDCYFADSLLTYRVPKGGDYYLQVRDSKYDGDPRWVYAVRATDRPSVSHVYPMAGNPGQRLEVEPVGSARLLKPRIPLHVPTETGVREVRLDLGKEKTNPTAFVVSPLPQVYEAEPNDTPERANRISIPCGINGRIGKEGDLDHFAFRAGKGRAIRFEVKARRFGTPLQSSLDSVLDVLGPKGKILASNDDTFGKDAALVFTPPADGNYVVRIRDLNHKGGDTAVYYLEADWARPDFTLRCDGDKAMIGPGTSTAWYVQAERQNGFTGPVRVDVKGLPPGVTASPLTVPPAMKQGLLVLTAGPNAPRDAAIVQVVGTGTVKGKDGRKEKLTRIATPIQEIYLPGGGRGRFPVGMQTVAVTDPSDILRVDVTPRTLVLRPGQEVRIDVAVHRRPDYRKGVTLDVLLRHLGQIYGNPLPPGVTIVEGKSKTLLGTGDKGYVTLRAAPNAAPVENVPISVLANVSVNFVVKIGYSSPAILLTVPAR